MLKITDITVNQLKSFLPKEATPFVGAGGRLIVRVYTDEGIVGIAEGSRNLSVFRAYIDDLIKPLLVGVNPLQPKRIWELLAQGSGQHATRFPPQVVGAIDICCWDILGKAAGLPVHTLLGGLKRREIPLYWSRGNGWNKAPGAMLQEVQEGFEKGFRAFKVRMDWRDYRQDGNPMKDFAIFRTCREWLPDDVPLGFDANNGYSVSTAIEQGRRLESFGVAHFEEPLPQYDLRGLRQVVDALDCAVSTGEQETSSWRFRDLMDLGESRHPAAGHSERRRPYRNAAGVRHGGSQQQGHHAAQSQRRRQLGCQPARLRHHHQRCQAARILRGIHRPRRAGGRTFRGADHPRKRRHFTAGPTRLRAGV